MECEQNNAPFLQLQLECSNTYFPFSLSSTPHKLYAQLSSWNWDSRSILQRSLIHRYGLPHFCIWLCWGWRNHLLWAFVLAFSSMDGHVVARLVNHLCNHLWWASSCTNSCNRQKSQCTTNQSCCLRLWAWCWRIHHVAQQWAVEEVLLLVCRVFGTGIQYSQS